MQMSNFYKLQKGFIYIKAEVENNTIIDINIIGDFDINPKDALGLLEKHLKGVELNRELLTNAINVVYIMGAETPNVRKEDFVNAIMDLKKKK